jgi:hypothetical protein
MELSTLRIGQRNDSRYGPEPFHDAQSSIRRTVTPIDRIRKAKNIREWADLTWMAK